MFIDKYKPLYAADDELGADGAETVETTETPEAEPAEGPGSGRSNLRKQLEKGFEVDRKASERSAEGAAKGKAPKAKARIAGGAELEPAEAESVEGETPEAPDQPKTAAPEAFSKEAKAEWAKVPPTVQAAILKREGDVAKGVEELKGKYKDLDAALTPHMNAIRQHGHSPAQAVTQLFSWFQALGANPDVAFPALAKSFGYDLGRLAPKAATVTPAADPNAQPGAQPAGEIPPAVQTYINSMKTELDQIKQAFSQELGGLKNTFQQQSEAKTNEILANWSKGKAHFEAVRALMAQLIQSGAVPLKDGQVDLDGAYEAAIWANPEIRAKVQAELDAVAQAERKKKADAAKKAQEEQASKARKAAVSLTGGPPGDGTTAPARKGKGKSVRDSILEAREELSS